MGSVTNKVSDMENKISGTEFKKQRKKMVYLKIVMNNKKQAALNQYDWIIGIL